MRLPEHPPFALKFKSVHQIIDVLEDNQLITSLCAPNEYYMAPFEVKKEHPVEKALSVLQNWSINDYRAFQGDDSVAD